MKSATIYLFVFALLLSTPIPGQNFENIVLNHITRGSQNTDGGNSIAKYGNNVYVLWQDMDSTFSSYVSKSTNAGITFGTPTRIFNNQPNIFGSIAADNFGNIYVAYDGIEDENINGVYLVKSTDEATNFSTPIQISEVGSFPQVAAYNNFIYIFFLKIKEDSNIGCFFTRSTNNGSSFETPFEISDADFDYLKFDAPCSIDIDESGVIYCIWNDGRRDGTGTDIYYSKSLDNGVSFLPNIQINPVSDSSDKIKTGVGITTFEDNLYVVWRQEDDNQGNNRIIYFSRSSDNGQTFSQPIIVAQGGHDSPAITVNYRNEIYIAYPNVYENLNGLFCIKSINQGSTFSHTTFISEIEGQVHNPSILTDQNDLLYVTWTTAQDGNEDDVFFAKGQINTPSIETEKRYHETFDQNDETGWAFLAYDGNVFVQNGELNFSTQDDEVVHFFLPVGGTKDDFSIRVLPGSTYDGIEGGGIGRMGFKSYIGLNFEDSISVIYTEDIISYSEPNLTSLTKYPIPEVVTNMQLDVIRFDNNLRITAFINDIMFYSGELFDVDEDLFFGQIVFDVYNYEDNLEWSCDEVDLKYNPLSDSTDSYFDDFDNEHSPWFKFGDLENVAQSISISDGKMNFNYSGQFQPELYAIAPIGSVNDFTIEVEGSGSDEHNASFGISKFFDFKNYTTFFFDGDSVFIGYALNSYDLNIIASAELSNLSATKFKFSEVENPTNIELSVWDNDQLVLSAILNSVDKRLTNGQLAVGFFAGNNIDASINYVDCQNYTTGNEEEIIFPNKYLLYQNYPNPFNPSTNIRFALKKRTNINLKVFNVIGQKVAELINNELQSGIHEVLFNSENLSSGIYFYELKAGDYTEIKKMILLK